MHTQVEMLMLVKMLTNEQNVTMHLGPRTYMWNPGACAYVQCVNAADHKGTTSAPSC